MSRVGQVWRRGLRAGVPSLSPPCTRRARWVGGADREFAQTHCDSLPGFPLAESSAHDLRATHVGGQRGHSEVAAAPGGPGRAKGIAHGGCGRRVTARAP